MYETNNTIFELLQGGIFLFVGFIVFVRLVLTIWFSVEGGKRKIGGGVAFLICFFISPIIGGFAVAFSDKLNT